MSNLVRFSVSLEADLLEQFDRYCRSHKVATRSEAIRQLLRETLTHDQWAAGAEDAAATLTIVYDHHRTSLMERLLELHALCLEAQLAGLAAVAPGVNGPDADAASRTIIDGAGLGEFYGHGMGHGVGLQIHEAPTLRPESTDVLEAGNVVSVEPGIYLPEEGAGVRIEDLVLVTPDGAERLTRFTKELLTVD